MSNGRTPARDQEARLRAEKAQKFAAVVNPAARRAGYVLDRPRGGGKKKLAEAAGMSYSSTSRMLAGQAIPDPEFFPGLAKALHIPLRQLLIESELATPETLADGIAEEDRLTPAEAAIRVGIQRPSNIELFVSFANTLLSQEAAQGLVPVDKD